MLCSVGAIANWNAHLGSMAATPSMTNRKGEFSFPKALHLRRPAEFRRVYDCKCSVRDDGLVIYGRVNGLAHSRLGMSVSRKAGSAVARNRLRRLYREAFRLAQSALPPGIDMVFLPRGRSEPALPELMTSLAKLAQALARKLAARDRNT